MIMERSPIWKNSLFLFITQAIRIITNVFIAVGIARLYGPDAFGQFSIAYTIATICIVVADFGFDVLLTTEIANNRSQAALIGKKYFSMKIIFALLSCIIMMVIPSFKSFSLQSRTLIYTLALFVVFTTFTNFFNAIFRGFEKFDYEMKISFITNLLFLILLSVFGLLKIPLIFIMLLFVFSRLLGIILSAQKAITLVGTNFIGIDFTEWRSIISKILVYGLHFLFGNLFFQLDTILLGAWKNDYDVGIYKSAFNVMLFILIISDNAFNTFLPMISRLYNENIEKWKNLCHLYYKMFFILVLPISMSVFFYSDQIINILYGKKLFSGAVPVLKIFSLVILFRFIGEPYALMITTSKRQHLRMIIVISATAISFMLNYIIIPIYGFYGAAIVSLAVNFLVCCAYIFVNHISYLNWIFELKNILAFLIVILGSILLYFYQSHIIIFIMSVLLYIPVAYFGVFSNKEREIIFSNLFIRKKTI